MRRATLRALLWACGVLALGAWLLLSTLRARAHEQLASAGAAMFAYARASHSDGTRTLRVNGAALQLTSGRTRDTVSTLLDAIELRCRERGPVLDALAPLRARWPSHSAKAALLSGVLRSDNARGGQLACLDLGERAQPSTLLARIRAFVASGDLASVGDLRFIWATRAKGVTTYVAIWSEGRLPLRTMFPRRGDAPGADLPELPRPSAAQRLLHASEDGEQPLLVAYRSSQAMPTFVKRYARVLAVAGFALRPVASSPPGARGATTWLVRGPSVSVALSAASDGRGGTLIALAPLR